MNETAFSNPDDNAASLNDYFGKEVRPAFLARAQGVQGKIILIVIFAAAMSSISLASMPVILPAIIGCSFAPRYRWHITAWATLATFILDPFWFDAEFPFRVATQEGVSSQINFFYLRYGTGLFFMLFAAAVIFCKRRFSQFPASQRPVLSLLIFYFLLVFLASQHLCHGVAQVLLWSFIALFGGYFWFMCYALVDSRPETPSLLLQIGTFHPFWGSTTTPIGKGVANLRNVEALDAPGFAVSQIKAVRLIICCVILQIALIAMKKARVFFGVPNLTGALQRQVAGAPYAPAYCWISLVTAFFEAILHMASIGNAMVACARMAGFQLLRNTYKPLQAKTIAEFWNRFYFYFKELLVDFFFYPAFLRCFKRHRRLRIIFATFMAASVGNVIFHFMRDIETVTTAGFWGGIVMMRTYAFYSLLLTAGIVASQMKVLPPAGCQLSVLHHRAEYRPGRGAGSAVV